MTACDDVRLSLGALVLGALDDEEERRIRTHVAGCSDCAAEVAALEATAGLLAMAGPLGHGDGAAARHDDPVGRHDPRLLDGLLERVRLQRRRDRRRRWALGVAAATASAVVAGLGVVAVTDDQPAAPAQVAAAPTAQVQGSDAGVVLDVDLWRRAWGTAVHVDVSGVPGGFRCSLVAVGADGTREIAATWTVPSTGYDPTAGPLGVDGAVGMQVEQVSSFEVVTSDGQVLVVAS